MSAAPITAFSQLDPNGRYTYADHASWQFEELVELLRGRVVCRINTPHEPHQRTLGELVCHFGQHLRRGHPYRLRVGPYDVRLPGPGGARPDAAIATIVQPDLCVIGDPAKIEPVGCLGAPDFIIEVTSPAIQARDWREKFDLYEENGVGEYWLVSPQAASISAFVLDAATARYRLAGEYTRPGSVPCATLPELGLDWADVFPDAEGE